MVKTDIRKKCLLPLEKSISFMSGAFISKIVGNDPLIMINNEGKIIDVNEATELATGLSHEELIGSDFPNYFTEPEKAREGYMHVFNEGFVKDYPLAIHHKTGKVVDALYNGTIFRNEKGEIQGMFVAERDITEKNKAEEKLINASLYARSLIEASLDPLVTISVEGKITDVNKATELVTGLSRKELIGSDFSDYFTEPEKAREGYMHVFKEGFVKDYPLAIRHKAGKVTEVLYNATIFRNELGDIQGVFAAARDITERKKAEEKLRFTSLYARSLIEASLDPLVTISAEGKITDVNKATELVTGLSRKELIGSDFSDYFTEPEKAREGYMHVFKEGFVKDYPLAIRHKAGKVTEVLYNATIFRNELGDIQGVFAAARDITEQKQAAMRIKEQAELLDKAHDAITLRDLEDRIIYWNKAAERIYGWSIAEILGKKASDLLYEKEMTQFIAARKETIEKGEWDGELHQITKSGKKITVDSSWTLMCDNKGKPLSILTIHTDISDKKQLEAQMLRAQRLESIGTLASGIAHDLNNILTPIILSIQLLEKKLKDEKDKEILNVLRRNALRGADLVKNVLLFGKGVVGERSPIQMNHIISEVEKIIKETFPKSIEILRKTSQNLSLISGDATQLHQTLMNLCLNARDAMPNGGIIEISAENIYIDENYIRQHLDAKIGNYIVISVSDTGVGIPSAIRERLFEPFFTTKERGKGTGLGLSMVLAIVKSHAGFINVYSEVGKGTIFRIYLPVIAETETKTLKEFSPEQMGNGELILIVDDESSVIQMTSSVLESNGYKSISASDGAEALAVFLENRKDVKVVLMDMAMPLMDGTMGIRALRRIDPEVKIIAVSGLPQNGKFSSISGSINAFLAKPYTSESLIKTIQEVLNTT